MSLASEIPSPTAKPENDAARPRVLMCAPSAYRVLYEINPWMSVENGPEPATARAQWAALYRTLTIDIGAEIELVAQLADAPDMVFTANAGLVSGNEVFLAHFRHPQRQTEEPAFRAWFEGKGYTVVEPPDRWSFEGEGDALFAGDTLLAGYLKRSDIAAHTWLAERLHVEVLSLQLVDDRWYHLDTCLCPLDDRTVAYYPGAFDTYAQKVVEANFDTVVVAEEEALKFACNAVVIGRSVVLPAGCRKLEDGLAARGFTPFPIGMSEFMKAGGACKCLTLLLRHHGQRSAR